MTISTRRTRAIAMLAVLALVATGCLRTHVDTLAGDAMAGRDAGTAGGAAARSYLLDQIVPITDGVIDGVGGRYAHQQPFPGGVNVYGLVEGTERPDEIVVVGAHYDGLGTCAEAVEPDDDVICNGATDNATGVGVLVELATSLAENPPARSVLFAFWDAEEDGLAGSRYFANHPVVPLDDIVAYVNVDLVGANLLPSLAGSTFAVGAETGGAALVDVVDDAASGVTALDTTRLSLIFGANRSDHVPFVERQVPIVFFSDSTGGCYHGPDDESDVVDFTKLGRQQRVIRSTVDALADGTVTPTFSTAPPATFDDLLGLLAVVERAEDDLDLFDAATRAAIEADRATLRTLRDQGRAAFGDDDRLTVLLAAAAFVDRLGELPCDGFLPD